MLLAPLEPEEQKYWLDRSLSERLSVADLRLELRVLRGEEKQPAIERESRGGGASVCPHCGHELPSPTD